MIATETSSDQYSLAEPVRDFSLSKAERGSSYSDLRELQSRNRPWDRVIEEKINLWKNNPAALAEEDFTPPTWVAIQLAHRFAIRMRDVGADPPLRVVPDGDGGIVFEKRTGTTVELVECTGEGVLEYIIVKDSRVTFRMSRAPSNM